MKQKMRLGASVVVLALVVLAGFLGWQKYNQQQDPFMASAVTDPPFTSLTYALHTFLWWNSYDQMHVQWVRQANFSHVKQIFAWEDIQPIEDEWHWERSDQIIGMLQTAELGLVVRLSDSPGWAYSDELGKKDDEFHDSPPDNVDDFGFFCGEVATRYRGMVDAYQIWNEPNLTREWGNRSVNAAEYVVLLAACSDAIRIADPDAILISAGLSPTGNDDANARRDDFYLQDMYDAGFQQYIDVVGAHAAGFSEVTYGPDDAEKDGKGRWATFRRIEDLRKIMIVNGDAARQMAILEMGWTVADERHPTYQWFSVDEWAQADQLWNAYEYAAEHWRPWVGLMTTIYIADPAWDDNDEEVFFSVTLPNGWIRPAMASLSNMPKYCGERVIPQRDPGSAEAIGLVPTDPCD